MRTRLLDIKALQTLVTVAEEENMTAAARRLSYSQSAVSMQISRLEREVGVTLLRREQGFVRLTRLGLIAVQSAREMLELNDALREKLVGNEIDGVVRFGLPVDFAPLIRSTWSRFASLFPQVEMQVRSELSASLLTRLADREVDLAILTLPSTSERGQLLRREPLVWVGCPGTRVYTKTPIPLAIGPDGGCEFRSAALSCLREAGRSWRIAYESQAFVSLCSPVSVGLALTVAVPSMVGPGLEIIDSGRFDLPQLPTIDLRLCQASGRPSQATQRLAELLIEDVVGT